jgi:hypothetical protein
MGTIGDAYDNAVIESFWARMQTELLDRRRWKTRVGLANAILRVPGDLPQSAATPQRLRLAHPG